MVNMKDKYFNTNTLVASLSAISLFFILKTYNRIENMVTKMRD